MGLNLHTHLEGWVRPDTAADLARQMSVTAPAGGWEAALRMREPADLTIYLGHVAAAYPVLCAAESMRRVAREAVEDAAADGCDYLEIRFGPATHARPGFDIAAVIDAACAGLDEGRRATGMPVGLVVCALRHHDEEANVAVARAAAAAAGRGVVGSTSRVMSCSTRRSSPTASPSRSPLRRSRPHGPRCRGRAVERCRRRGRPARRAPDRPWLAHRRRPDRACVGGAGGHRDRGVPDLERLHRRRALDRRASPPPVLAAGRRVVVGDDNPVNIGTTLSAEGRRLEAEAGLTAEQVRGIQRTACEVAFTDEPTRAALLGRFASEG